MLARSILTAAATVLFHAIFSSAYFEAGIKNSVENGRGTVHVNGTTTILTPNNVTVRLKDTSDSGICETTPGVKSWSGYVDISADDHIFFWFFESRRDPANDPITLWLDGGPGGDSLIGVFLEVGPCSVNANYTPILNPHSFNEVSNLLFISQPVGVGFSYGTTKVKTTEVAAKAVWEALQAFSVGLPVVDKTVAIRDFNLFTSSYGGHYGPGFFEYFNIKNTEIEQGTINGTRLRLSSLGIVDGLISERIQAPFYPEFAIHNTYGIKAVDDFVYNSMKIALNGPEGCLHKIKTCNTAREEDVDRNTTLIKDACLAADIVCTLGVEGAFLQFSGRNPQDIRKGLREVGNSSKSLNFQRYVNFSSVQRALGVDREYSPLNETINQGFHDAGDTVYEDFLNDLGSLLDRNVRVSLIYGDADYICNWFGGEAVSLAIDHSDRVEFSKTEYAAMIVRGVEYGQVRQYGNLSFTRIYEAGHAMNIDQPIAAFAHFNRTINGFDVATGKVLVTDEYESHGSPIASHVGWPTQIASGPLGNRGVPIEA
ncbi:hypothetical protein ANO11243_023590 [Dothideomycetidae sp. 11243]|nr:hypothetical protein ANO11243_023590 [fungal sp. No.11243]